MRGRWGACDFWFWGEGGGGALKANLVIEGKEGKGQSCQKAEAIKNSRICRIINFHQSRSKKKIE